MENNVAVWNSHVHCYETPQIIKQIRVIVLHGNRGTVLRCYHSMTNLRSYPLWFSSTAGKEKEIICLSWSWRKRNNTGKSIYRRHQLEEMDHGMEYQFTHAVWSQGRGQFCWHMYPLRCRVSGPKKGCYTQSLGTPLPHEVQNSKSKRANLPGQRRIAR